MDVRHYQKHIHLVNNVDTHQLTTVNDETLEWLELAFLTCRGLQDESRAKNFLSKETYLALVFTRHSNVVCIRFFAHQEDVQVCSDPQNVKRPDQIYAFVCASQRRLQ